MQLIQRRQIILIILVIFCFQARADFVIKNLVYRINPDLITVNISTDLELNETIENALDKGITLVILLEFSLQRYRAIMWNERITRHNEKILLQHHGLSDRYLIKNVEGENLSSFTDIDQALKYINELGPYSLQLPKSFQFADDANYHVAARIKLDIEALPLPTRPMAYISPAWRLNSSWTLWQLQN